MTVKPFLPIAALFLVIVVSGAPVATADEKEGPATATRPVPTAAEIGEWISQLNDDRYLVRERATRQLLDAGPAALDQLQETADADRPEPADRSLWILRRLTNTKDQGLKRQALERLANLKKRPQVAAAARGTLNELQHQEAKEAIEQLGGRYIEGEFMLQAGAIGHAGRLDLDDRWQGGDAGLIHLRRLNGMRMIRVIGTDISATALSNELPHCASLQTVWLYGSKLTPEEVAKLRKLLPVGVEVDYRKGALLGVASGTPDGSGPAVVRMVTPGSAAAVAGIQQGDVIQKFNGEALANFKALTQKIGDQRPGDEVTLSVTRAGKPMDFKVKLGQWKTLEE
jgi:PDZ domain